MNQTIQNNDCEEIDLRQIVEVLLKRKKIVILFTVITTLAALLVNLAMPKIYRTQSILQIGTINAAPNRTQFLR